MGFLLEEKTGEGELSFFDAGEGGLLIRWQELIHPELNRKILSLFSLLEQENLQGVLEMIPAYCSLFVEYDPLHLSKERLLEVISLLYDRIKEEDMPPAEVYLLPTCYGGEYGPDLNWVAQYTGLSPQEVIDIHSSGDYLIYMLGFSPGFPYLGGMDSRIAVPRLKSPRSRIPAGSVAIAWGQTGIYPSPTPGGWRIIGRTPRRLFQPQNENPVLLKPGNYLRFLPIRPDEYKKCE